MRKLRTFVGAGGSFTGFKKAGFECINANEIDSDFLKTLVFNNPELENSALIDSIQIYKN